NDAWVPRDDPQAQIRPVPPLLAQAQPEDRQASQPRHVPEPSGCRKARTRRAVLQARRLTLFTVMAGLVPAIHALFVCVLKTWMPGTRPGMTAWMKPTPST